MQIIDEIEILEFFNLLISLAKSKWIDMEKVETQWKEAANELISKVSLSQPEYIDLINKVCKSEKIEQVLMHIYNNFVVNDGVRKEADKAFFMLLSRSNNEIKAVFEPKVIDILSVEDNHLLTVIELIKDDPMVKTLFIEKRYSKKLLESLISRAKTINDFYLYKRYSIALLDYYEIFEGELGDLRNEFINAFYSNYKYLTDTRILGYSWESLSDVKAKIEVLDSCIIEEILNEYPNTTKSKIQVEQIKALTSKLEPAKRNELRFIHIIKPKFSSKIERSIYKLLNEFLVKDLKFESDWEKIDGKFVQMYNKDSSIITFDSVNGYDEESFIIKYEEKELKIRFYANYEMQELYLEIDGDKIVVNDLEEVNEILTKNIQEKLSQWLNTNQSV
jgi:hypothetical protein